MDTEKVVSDFDKCTSELVALIEKFTPETFNEKPQDNGWSAAQVAMHILLLDKRITGILQTNAVDSQRPADEKIDGMKVAMEELERKFNAPELLQPPVEQQDKGEVINQLNKERKIQSDIIKTADMSAACTDVDHPAFGVMTRLEWVYFNIHHTYRHMQQISRIHAQMNGQDIPRTVQQ